MVIETTIRTPQFKFYNKQILDWTVQKGLLSTVTWEFEPKEHISGIVGMHKVSFHSEYDYLKYKVS